MDDVDRRILSRMSRSVELAKRPFRNMSEELGIPEGEVISRVRALKDAGVIRRIGAVLDPARLGWVSTLCAADIPEDRIEQFADLTRSMAEITHNYVRDGTPNCWFTVIAPTRLRVEEIKRTIEASLGVRVSDLPARRVFKIRVSFDLG